jgi:hypothetical protein
MEKGDLFYGHTFYETPPWLESQADDEDQEDDEANTEDEDNLKSE